MRRAALLCALLVATQARAGTYTWRGGLGGGGSRSDSWSTGGPRVSQPTWDWNADLSLGGVPFTPGLLQFLASGQYRSLWAGYPGGSSSTRGLGYVLSLSLLSNSFLPATFSATRTLTDFTADTTVQRTGNTLTTTESGTVLLRNIGYPTLKLSLSRSDFDNESFDAPKITAGTTLLSVGASHSTARQEFSATYDTGWNDGTYGETNYRSHSVQAWATTAITDDLRFRLSDRYFLRLPTVEAVANPRYDDNTFGAGLQWRPQERLNTSLDYGYRHLVVAAPETEELEQLGHSLRSNTAWRATEDVTVNGIASVQSTTERQDGRSDSGESALGGGGLTWRRLLRPGLEVTAGGSGSIGVAKPMDSPALLAWGVTASAGVTAAGSNTRGSATWTGSYQRNTSGLAGWTLSQQLNLTGDAMVRRALFRATALLGGARREDPILGTFYNRSLSLTLTASWGLYGVQASAGQAEGVSEALAEPGFSEGFFLPANFNTRTRYGTLSAGLRIPGTRVLLSALARTLSTEAPDRPIRHEHGASLTASYLVGATTFSLEERYSTGGTSGIWQSGNLVIARVMRTFGGRF